jgi:hypothetical protein
VNLWSKKQEKSTHCAKVGAVVHRFHPIQHTPQIEIVMSFIRGMTLFFIAHRCTLLLLHTGNTRHKSSRVIHTKHLSSNAFTNTTNTNTVITLFNRNLTAIRRQLACLPACCCCSLSQPPFTLRILGAHTSYTDFDWRATVQSNLPLVHV